MSATTLNDSSANKLVLEAFDSGWKSYETKGTVFFNQQTPERVDEKFSVTAADGSISSVAEGAAYPAVNITEVGSKTLSQLVYKKEIPVTKLMRRFDNYGVVLREAQKLGYRAKYAMDEVMANVLNNWSGTTTCWDGYALGYATHTIGDLPGQTQSNITTGALTATTLNSARTALQKQKDHGGKIMPTTGKFLIVPPDLAMTAFELTVSPDGPETANRKKNFMSRQGFQVVEWPLLTDTADWFLIAEKMFNRLQYLVSIPPSVANVRDDNTGNQLYQIDFACTAGAPDYLGVQVGNG